MTLNHILEESGPQIAALVDPSLHQTDVPWFYRPIIEWLMISGSVKKSNCGVKISVYKMNDDFTKLSIVVESKYDVRFNTCILTDTLTTVTLLGYVRAGMRVITAEMDGFGLLD